MKAAITESLENYSETPKLQCNLQNRIKTSQQESGAFLKCYSKIKNQHPAAKQR